ncbi:MAG: anthranilate phosphoribosyltransferase [Verrucomicrobiaceae bacterium]|jgi:anthranilate phosphoribosyltransferase|nr:anthranilate phosphoribosyltransferase [Verrucomicrobiaceae bacterium]
MNELIEAVTSGEELDAARIKVVVDNLLDEGTDAEQKAQFLEALSEKGESAAEIACFVSELLEHAVDPGVDEFGLEEPTIDVCGTGGDKLNLFNVSTTSMFVIAAGGVAVLKHGNRGITSKSGGADVLEALGVRIDLPPEGFRECLAKAGVGFLFAPVYHPAFKAIMPVRKILAEKGVRTIFNLIGPLLNPARPERQLVGVFNPALPPVYAEILERMGRESAWAVHGTTRDGLPVDELSTMGPTRVCRSGVSVDSGDEIIEPRDFGLAESGVEELQGGDAGKNAEILTGILNGSDTGPRRDIVLLNAGAGLACAGVVEDLKAGVEKARELVVEGAAFERLRLLQQAFG